MNGIAVACSALIGMSDAGIDWLSEGGPEPAEVRAIRDSVEDPDGMIAETIGLAREFLREHCYRLNGTLASLANAECSCGDWVGPKRRSVTARQADFRVHIRGVLTDLRNMAIDGDAHADAKHDPALEARVASDQAKGAPGDHLIIKAADAVKPQEADCYGGDNIERRFNPCGRCVACEGGPRASDTTTQHMDHLE